MLFFSSIPDQRNLGMSMKVERSSLDQVKKRFEMNRKKQEEKQKEYDFNERMKELQEEVLTRNFYVLTIIYSNTSGNFYLHACCRLYPL